jgi:ATP-binding cassette subfamily B protein
VLEAGRLVAAGPHDTLLREAGLYARLAALQFDLAS